MNQATSSLLQTATLGGGCFWCLEAAYQQVSGVESVVSGYAGGARPHPSYEQVCTGTTGHAQVVQLRYDPTVLAYPDVLDIFWVLHDPTVLDRQDYDVGSQYRSIILYEGDDQCHQAEVSRDKVQRLWPNPIVTEIVPLTHFWLAEAYHQDYFKRHPDQAYCQIIINPKLEKLKQHLAARLK